MSPRKWRAMDEIKVLVIANEVMHALDRSPRDNPKLTNFELLSIVKEYTGDNTMQLIDILDAVSYLELQNAVDVDRFMGTVPPDFDHVKISITGRANFQVNRDWPKPKEGERAQEIKYSEKRPIRVFLSYSNRDLDLVNEIKKKLDVYCFETFLAHEDIEPSKEWEEVIILKLKECDVFIPFISENFKESKWTDQESGIAFADNKFIIPIDIGLVPYGFIGKYQALKYVDSSSACTEIIDTMIDENPLMKKRIQDDLIKELKDSKHFTDSNYIVKILEKFEPFTEDQVNKIIRGFLDNIEIQGSFDARPFVEQISIRYIGIIEPELLKEFNKFIARERISSTRSEKVAVNPKLASVGDSVNVYSDHHTAGEVVQIYFDFVESEYLLSEGVAGNDGSCLQLVTIPETKIGTHYFWVKDLATGISERANIEII